MSKKAKIYYFRFPTMPSKAEKLQLIKDTKLEDIHFEKISPDEKGNWINQTDNDFQSLMPLCSKDVKLGRSKEAIFELYSNGVNTARDEWVYDFSKENLEKKIRFFLNEYNSEVDRWIAWKTQHQYQDNEGESSPTVDRFVHERNFIKWSSRLKRDKLRKHKKEEFEFVNIQKTLYRPFTSKYLYFGYIPIDLKGEFTKFFPTENTDNQIIFFTNSTRGVFSCLSSNQITDLNMYVNTPIVCLSLYRYDNGERVENITDWALEVFRNHYGSAVAASPADALLAENKPLADALLAKNKPLAGSSTTAKVSEITKKDIFHYVYAVLHSPAYRQTYELDLKREFPRIPLYADFWRYAEAGKKLMELHLSVNSEQLSVNSEQLSVNSEQLSVNSYQ
jgi:predicted helicase